MTCNLGQTGRCGLVESVTKVLRAEWRLHCIFKRSDWLANLHFCGIFNPTMIQNACAINWKCARGLQWGPRHILGGCSEGFGLHIFSSEVELKNIIGKDGLDRD